MATLTLTLPAGGAVTSALHKATLIGDSGVPLTLPITDPSVDLGELAPAWTQVAAPGLVAPAFTVRGPRPLHSLTLTLTLVNPANMLASIEPLLTALYNVTQSNNITLAYGTWESSSASMTATGKFVCQSYKPTITHRDPSTNDAIQGTATLVLLEANPPPVIAAPTNTV